MYLDRKAEIEAQHQFYLEQHAEVRAISADFLQHLLLFKPHNVYEAARSYFQEHRVPGSASV